jgi:hypothetical protein
MPPRGVVIPHSSLLKVSFHGDFVHLTCPECRAEVTALIVDDTVSTTSMLHEYGCTVLARIQRLEQRLSEAMLGARRRGH